MSNKIKSWWFIHCYCISNNQTVFLSAPRGLEAAEWSLCQEPPGVHLGPVAPQLFGLATAKHSCELNGRNQPILIYVFTFSWEIIHFQGKSQRNVSKYWEDENYKRFWGLLLTWRKGQRGSNWLCFVVTVMLSGNQKRLQEITVPRQEVVQHMTLP